MNADLRIGGWDVDEESWEVEKGIDDEKTWEVDARSIDEGCSMFEKRARQAAENPRPDFGKRCFAIMEVCGVWGGHHDALPAPWLMHRAGH